MCIYIYIVYIAGLLAVRVDHVGLARDEVLQDLIIMTIILVFMLILLLIIITTIVIIIIEMRFLRTSGARGLFVFVRRHEIRRGTLVESYRLCVVLAPAL